MTFFWIVRVKRPLKVETFKIFKRLSPAVSYRQRSLRMAGTESQIRKFTWGDGI